MNVKEMTLEELTALYKELEEGAPALLVFRDAGHALGNVIAAAKCHPEKELSAQILEELEGTTKKPAKRRPKTAV